MSAVFPQKKLGYVIQVQNKCCLWLNCCAPVQTEGEKKTTNDEKLHNDDLQDEVKLEV